MRDARDGDHTRDAPGLAYGQIETRLKRIGRRVRGPKSAWVAGFGSRVSEASFALIQQHVTYELVEGRNGEEVGIFKTVE